MTPQKGVFVRARIISGAACARSVSFVVPLLGSRRCSWECENGDARLLKTKRLL
jgi:hypothetical protein